MCNETIFMLDSIFIICKETFYVYTYSHNVYTCAKL